MWVNIFSHEERLAQRFPPSTNREKSSEDGVQLPMWRGNEERSPTTQSSQAMESINNNILSMYDCMCTPGDNTPECSAGGRQRRQQLKKTIKQNVSLLEQASLEGLTDWNWPL